MTRDLIFFNFQLSIQQWNIMGVNKKVEKRDRYITCNSEDSCGCCWSNLMIVPDEGSSRHGEGCYPGLSWSESLVTFSPGMLGLVTWWERATWAGTSYDVRSQNTTEFWSQMLQLLMAACGEWRGLGPVTSAHWETGGDWSLQSRCGLCKSGEIHANSE